MKQYSRSGVDSLPVRFLQETFPIIGNVPLDLKEQIGEERRISAHDLWIMPQDVRIAYNLPFEATYDEQGFPLEEVEINEITVRRENASVMFEAVAIAGIYDPTTSCIAPHPDYPNFIAATAKLSIGRILKVVKEYAEYHLGNSDIIRDFAKAGMIEQIEEMDKGRQLLHYDIGRIIKDSFEGGPLVFREDHAQNRYLATALMMHVLPASLFEQIHFMEMNVGVKYKDMDAEYARRLEYRNQDSPFKVTP